MAEFLPLDDAEFKAMLKGYRSNLRDRIVVKLANTLLKAGASREYNAITAETIRRGWRAWPWPNPPFTEPMEADEPAGEETR